MEIMSMGKGRRGVCWTQITVTYICKMIQIFKALVSVTQPNAWPSFRSKETVHCSLGAQNILGTEGVGKKTLGVTAAAIHRRGRAA